MRLDSRSIIIVLTIIVAANLAIGQTQPNPKNTATNPPKQQNSDQAIGKPDSKFDLIEAFGRRLR